MNGMRTIATALFVIVPMLFGLLSFGLSRLLSDRGNGRDES